MENSKTQIKLALPILGVLCAFAALMLRSAEAAESAANGIELCARVIIPSLLPFFVLSNLLSELGLPHYIGRLAAPFMSRMFNVGGHGAAVFVLGVSGGYPVGAAAVADLYSRRQCPKDEAERLLAFCNNSGPAFIVGAAGAGIFKNSAVGLKLYLIHILAAALVGMLFSGKSGENLSAPARIQHFRVTSFAEAFAICVKNAIASTMTICGFIIFFSVAVGVLETLGIFSLLIHGLSMRMGLSVPWARSLLVGILELGSGIGSMNGLAATAPNLALAAFILGWGGISVHCQVLAAIADTDLSSAKHTLGKCLHGLISALLALVVFR